LRFVAAAARKCGSGCYEETLRQQVIVERDIGWGTDEAVRASIPDSAVLVPAVIVYRAGANVRGGHGHAAPRAGGVACR
jgi:hypothetical protein